MSELLQPFVLLFLGLVAGAYGAMIGAGGGFILVPVMLLLPGFGAVSPQAVTSISLFAVFWNAVSASVTVVRQGRVDLQAAAIFGLCAIPGSVIGRLLIPFVDRPRFEVFFGVLLLAISIYLVVRKPPQPKPATRERQPFGVVTRQLPYGPERRDVSIDLRLGSAFATAIGAVASLAGVGGGLMLVPALVGVLGYPVIIATATSQVFLSFTSFTSLATDWIAHPDLLLTYWPVAVPLALGVIVGAQFGAQLSRRLADTLILRLLAGALLLAAARLIWDGVARW